MTGSVPFAGGGAGRAGWTVVPTPPGTILIANTEEVREAFRWALDTLSVRHLNDEQQQKLNVLIAVRQELMTNPPLVAGMNALEEIRAAAVKEREDWAMKPWKGTDAAALHSDVADLLEQIADDWKKEHPSMLQTRWFANRLAKTINAIVQ